jgi:glycosyltransferase involved in cell wall biosynthesis
MKILITDNQIIYPPEGGGPKRIFNLFSNMGNENKMHYVGVSGYLYLHKLNKKISNNFYEDTISLNKPFILINNFFHNLVKSVPTFDIICYYFMFLNPQVKKRMKNLAKKSDVVISSHPWMFSSINFKNKLKVYDAHNCEYQLYKKFFKNNLLNNLFCRFIFAIERKICRESDIILACSETDKRLFVKYYKVNPKKIHVVPNPIGKNEINQNKTDKKKSKEKLGLKNKKTILFIGSNFLPNHFALDFIVNNLRKEMKDFKFLIVGNICEHYFQLMNDKLKEINLEDVNIKNKGILGYGYFALEKWGKQGFDARWTKKEFNFFIKDKNINKIIIYARSLKRIKGTVFINGKKIKDIIFKTGIHFKKFEVPVSSLNNINCVVKLDKINRPLFFDTRAVGITIKGIEYIANKKKKSISLKKDISPHLVPDNVTFFGRVSNKKMNDIIAASDIAINPVINGSGINIKMLDYMAKGIPVVTTKIGARGFKKDKNDMVVSDLDNFVKNIIKLFENEDPYLDISRNSVKTVEDDFNAKKYADKVLRIIKKYKNGKK